MSACPTCGEENSERARFCQACGNELPVTTSSSPGERRLISALFVDLVDSTARADGRDPEETSEQLGLYYRATKGVIERFGGTVEKFIGDAVVAIFGAPVASGDDAERAVRAGLEVMRAIDQLNTAHPGLGLTARAGVNTGEALVAVEANPERGDAFATGDVLNTAARLEAAAPPGRVIVGVETQRASKRAIRYEDLEPIEVKGKRGRLEVWLAVAPILEGDRPAQAPTPLVGRERELALLTAAWRRVTTELRPELVTVLGEPGIGKSRLAAAFTDIVDAGAGGHLAGRSLPYEEKTGYGASADHVKRMAGILESDPPAAAREKLAATAAVLLPPEEVADVTRYLSLLLGLGTDEPTDARLPLFFAVRRLLETVAQSEPTVLIFEDLHWADPSQIDLIGHLLVHIRDVPILFLALARPEFSDRGSWAGARAAQTTIPLEPLSTGTATTLATALSASLSEDSCLRIVETAGGNPLFIEELAASVAERGGDVDALPSTVREAIAARIDLVSRDERETLLAASVIGRTFWRTIVGALHPGLDIDVALDTLETRDLVRRERGSRVAGDVEYSFKHGLVREVAYATLPRAVRRDLHAAVGRYLEEAASDHLRDVAWLLAHHWREAGDRDRAVRYLVLAAEHALEGWAKEEAIALFDEAVNLVGDDDPDRAVRLRLQRAMSLVDLSDFERGAQELDELMPALHGSDELEAVLARARTTIWLEQTDATFSLSNRGRVLAESLHDAVANAAATAYLASAHLMTGDLAESLAQFEHSFDAWVPGTRPVDFAAAKEQCAEVYYWTGDYVASEETSRAAYEIGGEIHHVEPLLRGGGWRGLTLAAMGRTEEAIELLDSVVERARDLGSPRWSAAPLNYSTLAFRDLFLVDEARRRNEEAVDLVEKHGEWGMPRLQGEIDLLITDLLQGEPGRAAERWPILWDAAINGRTWRPWLGGVRLALVGSEIALATGDVDVAIERAHETIERGRRTMRRKYEAGGFATLARALIRVGKRDEAAEAVRAAVAIDDRLGGPTERWRHRVVLGDVLDAAGDVEGAAAAYREAGEVLGSWTATLSPSHAATVRGAEEVRDLLARL
jgi:class 3 adenylate cyclase/tetratricopeptide (TPR) repeat protein